MRDYLGRARPAYTPEEVVRLANVFDEAWRLLGAGDGLSEAEREVRRTALARRIVELAEGGLHNDPDVLRDAAVASLKTDGG
jgi:hypothetical protein